MEKLADKVNDVGCGLEVVICGCPTKWSIHLEPRKGGGALVSWLGAGHLIAGGWGWYFRKKITYLQSWPQKIVCSINCGEKLFVHLCVRKKKIVDNQQIFPSLPETAKESQRNPSLRSVKSLMHEDIIPAHWNEHEK